MRAVKAKLADGSEATYLYHRATNARLPALDDPAFPKALEAAERSIGRRPEKDTLRALVAAYKGSPGWRARKPNTQAKNSFYLGLLAKVDHVRVVDVKRRMLLELRDSIAESRGPAAANAFAYAASGLFKYAVAREWCEYNPMAGVEHLEGGEFPTWTEQEYAHAVSNLPEHLRRVVVLAAYLGQRRGDLCALTWAAYDGKAVRLTQQKTKVFLRIPAHPDLRAELEVWRRDHPDPHILRGPTGIPYGTRNGGIRLSNAMLRALEKLGLRDRANLNNHGLRKLACVRLAEAGCSAHEIMSITGHKTLKEVERYTAAVRQDRLAEAAIIRLPTTLSNGKKDAK